MGKTFKPGYLKLLATGALENRVQEARKHLTNCNLCPHECNINRKEKLGFCRATDQVVLAGFGPHFGEEQVLVGRNGSGTVFFGYCNMRCVYCQNCEISFGGEGELITNEELANIMVMMQERYQCHNINLVTSTHFVPNILEAVLLAAQQGLTLPLVYNCGGYERRETLALLEGIIDIYMPDFKYHVSEMGQNYSQVKDYSLKVKEALKTMDSQVGGLKTDASGLAYRGLIIRHLMLPGSLKNTLEVLKFIKEELSSDCLVNLMDQYYPAHKAFKYEKLARPLSSKEYKAAYQYARELGLRLS